MSRSRDLKRAKRFLSPQERKAQKNELAAYKIKGYGLYEYQNRLNATLGLPKPLADGKTKTIAAGGKFEGDDYFMYMVPTELRVLRVIIPADEERKKEMTMNNQKLILDQPETVTNEGVVEFVVSTDLPLNENDPKNQTKKEVLINEDPIDGVKIILS